MKSADGKRILIVEDQAIIALSIEDTLQKMGYRVATSVATAEKAIQVAGETRPDLILMDIHIRGDRDGIDAAMEINRLYQIPVVYLTAHSDQETLDRAKKTLPYGYIIKPFRDRDLYTTIEIALYKHRLINGKQNDRIKSDRPETTIKLLSDLAQKEPSESLREQIIDRMDSPVFILDPQLKITYHNPAFAQLLRELREAPSWAELLDLKSESMSLRENFEKFEVLSEAKQSSRKEITVRMTDATVTFSAECISLSGDTEQMSVGVILHDISSEKQHAQRVHSLERRYGSLIMRMGEVLHDASEKRGNILSAASFTNKINRQYKADGGKSL